MNVHDCIFFQLSKASLTGAAFWSKKVEHLGVTASQAMVLNFLGEEDQIPPHALRQKLQITSATMTGILDRLERLGLIVRKPHSNDRRAVLACLTGRGRKYAQEINDLMIAANQEFLNGFDSKRIEQFRQMLQQLQEKRL
ncbi:MAG: MarR family transcriptional regulator [Bacillota bacterium]|nr:MarR family transcriptional regulator [Bacillota bacterium]